MRRCLLAFPAVASLLIAPDWPVAALPNAVELPIAAPREREPMDEAIDAGLIYLGRTQNVDGSWSAATAMEWPRPRGNFQGNFQAPNAGTGDMAVTALAVMAFLSAGHVPGEGPYGDAVAGGIRFVLDNQQANGILAARNNGGAEMYYHGICTLMLAEVVGMTDAKRADELRKRLETAVAVIFAAQRKGNGFNQDRDRGGWRYAVSGFDADLSVTGWQVLALRAAKNVGCDVPQDRIAAAVEYVKRCHDARSGGFTYTTFGNVTVPCTGVGILCLELSGKEAHQSAEAVKAGSHVLKTPLNPLQQHFYYGVYYTSQAMFQLGENYWKSYHDDLHKLLLRTSAPNANGSWTGRGFDDARYGAGYCTAMAILALTVEYRYLPIYQRFEEPLERDGKD